jgi:alkylation response protein AidB-like acyl-CoA dehydrogenase
MDVLPEISEHEEFRAQIARWVDERLKPAADEIDRKDEFALDLFRELGALGYFGIMYPEEYGGSGVESQNVLFTIMIEELARASMAFAGTVGMHSSTATYGIFTWGSEDLKQRYLVPSIRGEKIGAFALTEANAGSDAAAIKTRAHAVEGGYVLNGTKMFTSNSTFADFIIVAATSDPTKGARGIGLFLVDVNSAGFSVGRKIEKFVIHSGDTAETIYNDVFVPEDCRLGNEQGFLNAYRALTVDRIFTAALALGNARAAYEAALLYAGERAQFGQPIGKFQGVQFKLVDMLAMLEQARLYVYHVAKLADEGKPITREAALAKMIAADSGNAICQKALNIFGGYGLTKDFPVERYLRDSFFPIIGGGTSDIMRVIAAREMGL